MLFTHGLFLKETYGGLVLKRLPIEALKTLTGSPPPAGSKNDVLKFLSVNNMVIALILIYAYFLLWHALYYIFLEVSNKRRFLEIYKVDTQLVT
jgi:hypothetical protein